MMPPLPSASNPAVTDWWTEATTFQLEALRTQLQLHRWGLRFRQPATEQAYRIWHQQMAVPYTRIGMIASVVCWSLGVGIMYWTMPERFAATVIPITLLLYPTMLFCLVTTTQFHLRRWMLPSSALANALAGLLVAFIAFVPPAWPEIGMALIIIPIYFGYTIFRLHVTQAAPTVFSYIVLNEVLLVNRVWQGALTPTLWVVYSTPPLLAFLTGLMVCGVLDHVTRQTYQQAQLLAAQTTALEHERQRANGLLYTIFPQSIAERLKTQPGGIAEQFEQATIVFADLVGFTPLATTLTPSATVALLSQIFEAFDAVAARHGVEKIKTIGDAYMAVVGVPHPHPHHAVVAVQFALELREAITQLSAQAGVNLALRIGLHTGPVMAGVIGRQKLAYDLWGDTVNTASRMESQGAAGVIQITEATYLHIKDRFSCDPQGVIAIKGKGNMPVWHVRQ